MKRLAFVTLTAILCIGSSAHAQTPPPDPPLDGLGKKLDELNAKIDALSQELLKVEQHLANQRPGVIIGEPTPAATTAPAQPPQAAPSGSAAGNSHTIAKGETLTSIAKMHHVPIDELQKANHIENDRKLQVGQTLIIPAPSGSPSPSASGSPGAP